MSRLPALTLICGFVLFGYAPAGAQSHILSEDAPVFRRWSLSFNPFGMLEDPGAIGAGIGFQFNKGMEFWGETSFLHGWEVTFPNGGLKGFRQIIRFSMIAPKSFLLGPNVFFAVELRYRNYSYRDTSDFLNAATGDKLVNIHFLSKHYIFGGALQVGYLFTFSAPSRWMLEVTFGLGLKVKQIIRKGPPAGYQYLHVGWSIDPNIREMVETPGGAPYFPGSLRIIYTFGRKLK